MELTYKSWILKQVFRYVYDINQKSLEFILSLFSRI